MNEETFERVDLLVFYKLLLAHAHTHTEPTIDFLTLANQ